MSAITHSPPRAPVVKYEAPLGTRWEKEKIAAGAGAFDYPDDPKSIGPWIIGECVGKGASGRVKIAKHCRTGQLAAVKILPLQPLMNSRASLATQQAKSEKQRLSIDREITMMKLMNHPNIMRIYDVYEGKKELYLVLEYVEGGELFDFLVNSGRLPPLEALAYFKQIIYGLNYAHTFSIIHRDLKPENILIHSLNPPLIKIADWGMAAFAPPALQLETSCGSPHYASPEIVNGLKYSGNATDIWSCGVILYALLTGRLPFDDKNVRTLLGKVKTGKYEMPAWIDSEAKDLISRMLIVDVKQRISIPEILKHPWFLKATPGIQYVPAPPVSQIARPLKSQAHIDGDLVDSLRIIWGRHADIDAIRADLLKPAGHGTLAKAFYFLLHQYREQTMKEATKGEESYPSDTTITRQHSVSRQAASNQLTVGPPGPRTSVRSSRAAPAPPRGRVVQQLAPPATRGSSRPRPPSPAGPRSASPADIFALPGSTAARPQIRVRPLSQPVPARSHAQASRAAHQRLDAPAPTPLAPSAFPADSALGASSKPRSATVSGWGDNAASGWAHVHTRAGTAEEVLTLRDGDKQWTNAHVRANEPRHSYQPPAHAMTRQASAPSPTRPRPPMMYRQNTAPIVTSKPAAYPVCDVERGGVERRGSFQRPERRSTQPLERRSTVATPALRTTTMDPIPLFTAPRTQNEQFQQAIDDITDKVNVLVARGNAEVQARSTMPGGYFGPHPTTTRQRGESTPAPPRLPVADKGDKENPNEESRRPVGLGLSSKAPLGMAVMEGVNRRNELTSKSIKRKTQPPTIDFQRTLSHKRSAIGSPAGSPAVGSWFSSLFNWKGSQQEVLYSHDDLFSTRHEARRVLEALGIIVAIEDVDGMAILRCRVEETQDWKQLRFRVEFSAQPMVGSSMSHGGGGGSHYTTAVVLVQERGSGTTLRAVQARLKMNWRLGGPLETARFGQGQQQAVSV